MHKIYLVTCCEARALT